jgi:hypothetical protein
VTGILNDTYYPPTPLAAGGARQGIRQEVATASYYYYYDYY